MGSFVKNISVRAIADFSDLQKASYQAQQSMNQLSNNVQKNTDKIKNSTKNLGDGMKNLGGGMGGGLAKFGLLGAGLGGFTQAIGNTVRAIQHMSQSINELVSDSARIDAMTQVLNDRLGTSADAFNNWAETSGKAMGLGKRDIAEYGNKFSNLLLDTATSTDDLANKTENFLRLSAILQSNGFGATESMERLTSALNGEVDGASELGVNVRTSAVESSKAFQEIGKGAKHMADLSSATQKQIMYQYILDELTRRYGDTVKDTANLRLLKFKKSIDDLKLSFGNLFLPILYKVLPALTSFINKITIATDKVTAFLKKIFGMKDASAKSSKEKNDKETQSFEKQSVATDKLTDKTKKLTKAKKELSNSLLAFDQINALPEPPSADSPDTGNVNPGGTTTTGGALPPNSDEDEQKKKDQRADDESWFTRLQGWLDALKPSWENLKEGVSHFWEAMKNLWNDPGVQAIVNGVLNAGFGAIKITMDVIGDSLDIIADVINFVVDVMNGRWGKAWDDIKSLVSDVYDLFANFIADLFTGTKVEDWLRDQFKNFKSIWAGITSDFEQWVTDTFGGSKIKDGLIAGFNKFKDFDPGKWWQDNVVTPMIAKFVDSGMASKLWDSITGFFTKLKPENWFKDSVVGKIVDVFEGTGIATNIWNNMKSKFADASYDVKKWFSDNVSKKIANAFETGNDYAWWIWDNIKKISTTDVKKWFTDNVSSKIKNALSDGYNFGYWIWANMRDYLSDAHANVKKWFTDNVTAKIKSAFTGNGLGSQIWSNIKGGITGVKTWFTTNIANPIKSVLSNLGSGIGTAFKSVLKSAWNPVADGINGMLDKLAGIEVLGGHPFKAVNDHKIPKLAKGGITNTPGGAGMLAVVGDNTGGREVVSPLNQLQDLMASNITNAILTANALQGNAQGQSGSGISGDVILNLDGRTLARLIKPYLDIENRRVGTNVRLNQI